MKCQCPPSDESFLCSLTGCEMTPHQRRLCKTRLNYREFYQERRCDHVADGGEMVNETARTQRDETTEKTGVNLENMRKTARIPRARSAPARVAPKGPGSHLKKLLAELGVKTGSSCGCNAMAAKMDAWGVEGCRFHRPEIVEHLRSQATWREKIAVAIGAVTTAATWLNPLDAAGSLLDEACRRCEEQVKREKCQ